MTRYAKSLIIILWKCWFLLLTTIFVLTIGVFWTLPFALSDRTFPLAFKGIRLWAILIFYGSGFRLKVERYEKLDPNQPYIFIANHTSIMDIMVMGVLHKHHPIVFVGKEELAKLPIFGFIYRKICITVDRSNEKSRMRVFKLARGKIQMGRSIVIFPEGGIPEDRSIILAPLKDGAISIAITTDVPIVVYSFKGLKEMFPWSWTEGYPGTVRVKMLDIIPTKELTLRDKDKVKELCYQLIYNDLIEG